MKAFARQPLAQYDAEHSARKNSSMRCLPCLGQLSQKKARIDHIDVVFDPGFLVPGFWQVSEGPFKFLGFPQVLRYPTGHMLRDDVGYLNFPLRNFFLDQ
ncbi:MAG: hypothetical protein AAGU11_12150 [Syntrophobacteraceae bacterium]